MSQPPASAARMGLTTSLRSAGDRLLQIANEAGAKAAAAVETTRQRMQQSAEDVLAGTNSPRDEVKVGGAAVQTPPSKAGRKTRCFSLLVLCVVFSCCLHKFTGTQACDKVWTS